VLFLQTQPGETSILGIFSPTGATGTATLHGPNGSVRGGFQYFLPANNRQESNTAFDAFGVGPENGDYVTFDVTSGEVFPYVTLFQATGDAAVELPVATAAADFAFPVVGASAPGPSNGTIVTHLLFANPSSSATADAKIDFFPASGAAPSESFVAVPPGDTIVVPYTNPALGLGAVVVKSSLPLDAVARFANRTAGGDFASIARAVIPGSVSGRFLVSSDTRLRRTLFLYNRGVAGTVILTFRDVHGAIGKLELPVGDHRLLVVSNIQTHVGAAGGRIDYAGSAGTALYGWLAATDPITGDSDAQEALPTTP